LFAAASVLLVVAGAPKIVAPTATLQAARQLRLPFLSATTVRLFGAAEVSLAVLAVVVGGRALAVVVGVGYVGFAALVARAVIRGDVSSCGCFAGEDSPPSLVHVAIDLGLAAAAFLTVRSGPPSLTALVSRQGSGTVAVALASAVVDAGLVYLVMVRFPRRSDPVGEWRDSDRLTEAVELRA
jgi:hypothetical protein